MNPDQLRALIAEVSLIFAVLSFLLYLRYALQRPTQKAEAEVKATAAAAQGQAAAATPQQVIDLVNAVATLTEALAKAGPALWSLVGAVLFLLVAALASGAFQTVAG